jgi:hypothetical protein
VGDCLVESLKLRLSDFHEWSEKYNVASKVNAQADSPSIGSAERQQLGRGDGSFPPRIRRSGALWCSRAT